MENVLIDKKIILAPMAGITDLPFRLICKKFGADTVYSEMVSAAGLFYNQEKTKKLLKTVPEEWPAAFQLFGSKPEHFAKAVELITNQLKKNPANQLDINFGCPVKKVIKQGAGCALVEKPDLAKKIIKAVLENTTLPVSLKIRAGIKDMNALDFLKKLADLNWKTAVVHGRTYKQGFSGPADLSLIRKIKESFPKKIIIANGGIMSPENAKEVLGKTGADGVAIARGALGNPWIFQQIRDYFKIGRYSQPNIEEIKNIAIEHLELFLKYKGEKNNHEFRKHLGWYFKGIPDAKKIRNRLFQANNFKAILKLIKSIK